MVFEFSFMYRKNQEKSYQVIKYKYRWKKHFGFGVGTKLFTF